MKLYRRQLNSVEELRREKLRLQFQKLHTDRKDFFPVREHGKPDNNASTNFIDFAGSLFGARSPLQFWLKMAGPVLRAVGKKQAPKKALLRVAKEVLLGYAKWKVIEMTYRAIRLFIKKEQRRKHAKKAA